MTTETRTSDMTREEAARLEVGRTEVSRPLKVAMLAAFLTVIAALPLVEFTHAVLAYRAGERATWMPKAFEIFLRVPEAVEAGAAADGGPLRKVFRGNAVMLQAITEFEADLEDTSVIGSAIRPPAQLVLAAYLGSGNESAYVGRGRWLFFRPGIDALTGEPFLDPVQLARRAGQGSEFVDPPQPDPLKAVLQFHEQLVARGIPLVVVPAPVKPTVHPERFSAAMAGTAEPVHNPSYDTFIAALRDAGGLVFDPAPLLVERKREAAAPKYLATDTHWRPEAMERTAEALAAFLAAHVDLPARPAPRLEVEAAAVTGEGDVAALLDLPPGQTAFPGETVTVRRVTGPSGDLWRADPGADVLVLGDSFANIYSLGAMGWGESAGLVEHLARALGRPVDRLIRNDAGAHATREMLSRELARGRDRLAGKRVVVWEFATRELAVGDWTLLPMELGAPPARDFVAPEPGRTLVVMGTVATNSGAPRPGTVPYRDHILNLHLVDVAAEGADLPAGGEAVVQVWSMRDNVWTEAPRLRVGDRVRLRLTAWADTPPELEQINRSELADMRLRMQEPAWGEILAVRPDGQTEAGGRRTWPVWLVAAGVAVCLGLRLSAMMLARGQP